MKHIMISVSHRQLYLYEDNHVLRQFPIAIGKPQTPTPVGEFTIANKTTHPGGVFGSRWLGLSQPRYGIHGTNAPSSIGQSISKGCIRMHNQDVEYLFSQVQIGTRVKIRS